MISIDMFTKLNPALHRGFMTGHHLKVFVIFQYLLLFLFGGEEGGGELEKQCTDLSPVNGIMTCAWVENTINDNLILGLLKKVKEKKNKHNILNKLKEMYRCIAFHLLIHTSLVSSLSSNF